MGRSHPAHQLALLDLQAAPDAGLSPSTEGASNGVSPAVATLEARLSRALGAPLRLTITDNRRTMLSIRRVADVRHVRLHHMFAGAPVEVLDAVAGYLAHGDRRAGAAIDAYVRANGHRIRHVSPPVTEVRVEGAHHDLGEILGELIARYCPDTAPVTITWGRQAASARRARLRTIRMGAYLYEQRVIRIHPALDQPWVPRFFVAWVVFHELLHHVIPALDVGGRRVHHTADFRAREATFHDRDRALEWEQRNVRRLIASRDL